jgi:transposase-like protein
MPKPKPAPKESKPADTDVEAAIRAVVDSRRSYRAVGKEFGVSHVQVRRWVLAWRLAHPEALSVSNGQTEEADSEPAVEEATTPSPWSGLTKTLAEQATTPFEVGESEDLSAVDGLDLLKQTIADQRANIKALRKAGNTEAAGRAARDMAANVNALARLEAARPLDDGAIVFSKEEYISTEAKIEATLRLLLQGHALRCADCGRALAIEWGTGKAEPEVDEKDEYQGSKAGKKE